MLTGWGTSCQVWRSVISELDDRFQFNCIKPSWEARKSLAASLSNLDGYVNELAESLSDSVSVVAWSLGGLVAIRLATYFPAKVNKIIFVASTSKFVVDGNELGIERAWFDKFEQDFKSKPLQTLKKFFALQVRGDKFAKETLQQLRTYCEIKEFNLEECAYGLNLLGQLDLSDELIKLPCKSLFIHGECDAVLPVAAGRLAASKVDAKFYSIPLAGHIPLLSHPQVVAKYLLENID